MIEMKESIALGQSKLGSSYRTNFGLFTTNIADRPDSPSSKTPFEYTQTTPGGQSIKPDKKAPLEQGFVDTFSIRIPGETVNSRPETNFGGNSMGDNTSIHQGNTINSIRRFNLANNLITGLTDADDVNPFRNNQLIDSVKSRDSEDPRIRLSDNQPITDSAFQISHRQDELLFTEMGQSNFNPNRVVDEMDQEDDDEKDEEDEGIVVERQETNLRFNRESSPQSRQDTDDEPEEDEDLDQQFQITQQQEILQFDNRPSSIVPPDETTFDQQIKREVYRASNDSQEEEDVRSLDRLVKGTPMLQTNQFSDDYGYENPIFGQGPMRSHQDFGQNNYQADGQLIQDQEEGEQEEINRVIEEPEAY